MNPLEIPMSGASWIEIALALGASVVFLIYLYQSFFPRLQSLFGLKPDPEVRAAALLDQYKQRRAAEAPATALRDHQGRHQASSEEGPRPVHDG